VEHVPAQERRVAALMAVTLAACFVFGAHGRVALLVVGVATIAGAEGDEVPLFLVRGTRVEPIGKASALARRRTAASRTSTGLGVAQVGGAAIPQCFPGCIQRAAPQQAVVALEAARRAGLTGARGRIALVLRGAAHERLPGPLRAAAMELRAHAAHAVRLAGREAGCQLALTRLHVRRCRVAELGGLAGG